MREEYLQPPSGTRWEAEKAQLIDEGIRKIALDIYLYGMKTLHAEVYDAIYELIESDMEETHEKRYLIR